MNLSRFKNYGLWVSIAALVPMVLQGFGLKVLPDNYSEIVTAVLGILVMAGILNNPTTGNKGYLDDKTQDQIENTGENK
ncbi:holin [uncultured Clostridium sp.]|uniref:holin n=1 Tax=uncultured Clostridium sp. TaxID=59620 RepID=UPI00260D04FF|nr:holin [uncultured Clostridium sp.]